MSTNTPEKVSARPFLKWAGGKSKLIQQYIPYFPQSFTNYYEPFLGGGAIFFHLQPHSAILTDINSELINVYRCVRDNVEDLIQHLEFHQIRHSRLYYYKVRSHPDGTDIERAARLIYLNKTCFNGLYRENSKGQFNVPIGKSQKFAICQPALLRSASLALKLTQIEVRDFEQILNYANKGDFVYFDPPYHPISATSNFTSYSRYSFTQDDQIRLRDVFTELARREVKVILSNSDCEFIRAIYSEFKIHRILAARAINSNGKKRGKIAEVIVTSY